MVRAALRDLCSCQRVTTAANICWGWLPDIGDEHPWQDSRAAPGGQHLRTTLVLRGGPHVLVTRTRQGWRGISSSLYVSGVDGRKYTSLPPVPSGTDGQHAGQQSIPRSTWSTPRTTWPTCGRIHQLVPCIPSSNNALMPGLSLMDLVNTQVNMVSTRVVVVISPADDVLSGQPMQFTEASNPEQQRRVPRTLGSCKQGRNPAAKTRFLEAAR